MTELRRYASGKTYRPLTAEQRKHRGPRFRGDAGEYFGHHWLPALPLLPDEERVPPQTLIEDVSSTVSSD